MKSSDRIARRVMFFSGAVCALVILSALADSLLGLQVFRYIAIAAILFMACGALVALKRALLGILDALLRHDEVPGPTGLSSRHPHKQSLGRLHLIALMLTEVKLP